ncbi:MAG: sigma-70 family RNA polymerase sigma factor [Acidobacteriota bacterium]
MKTTLRQYLDATDDAERDGLLEELILVEAMPAVRRTVSYRLRFCLGGAGSALLHPDAEDLCHEVVARLVRRLEMLRARKDPAGIREFAQYAARVASNACNDYLRQKYPARARLKDRLRDLLERHPDFALWRRDDVPDHLDEFCCGFRTWRALTPDPIFADRVRRSLEYDGTADRTFAYPGELGRQPLAEIVSELFNRGGGPIAFEALLAAVAIVLEIKGDFMVTFDENLFASEAPLKAAAGAYETRIEKREVLLRVWQVICKLPVKQRSAFFFSFSDQSGDDLLSLLLDADVATPIEVAARLEMSLEGLMIVAKEMPLDNATLAVLLGTTRQNINKWRYRANCRLQEELLESRVRK